MQLCSQATLTRVSPAFRTGIGPGPLAPALQRLGVLPPQRRGHPCQAMDGAQGSTQAAQQQQLANTQSDPAEEPAPPPPAGLRKGFMVGRAKRSMGASHLISALQQLFPDLYHSETGAKRACRRKEVFLDGSVGSTTSSVSAGQWIQLAIRAAASAPAQPAQGPSLDICYEDDHIAVINKPAGLPTQGSGEGCVQGRVKYCLTPCSIPGALKHPVHAHRLDAATTGLVLICKTRLALTRVSEAFQTRQVKKRYVAVVKGTVSPAAGLITCPLGGKPCLTEYRVQQVTASHTYGALTTLSLTPHTGRKHQLRRHCAEVLCSGILGDPRYTTCLSRAKQHYIKPLGDCHEVKAMKSTGIQQADGCSITADGSASIAAQVVAVGSDEGVGTCDGETNLQGGGVLTDAFGDGDDEDEGGADEEQGIGCVDGDDQPDTECVPQQAKDVLIDGRPALLCLAAVELGFTHPATGQSLVVSMPEPAFFQDYRNCESEPGVAL